MMTGKRKSRSGTAVDVAARGRNDTYEHLAALNGRPCEEHATVEQAAAADARAIAESGAIGEMFNGMMDEWIPQAAKTYQNALLGDQRFVNAKTLLANFDRAAGLWAKRKSNDDVKALTETANELAAAASILGTLEKDQTLTYERALTRTRKSIDFVVEGKGGPVLWIDVKTVAPEWVSII